MRGASPSIQDRVCCEYQQQAATSSPEPQGLTFPGCSAGPARFTDGTGGQGLCLWPRGCRRTKLNRPG